MADQNSTFPNVGRYANQIAGATGEKFSPQSAFDKFGDTFRKTEMLVDRVERIASALFGEPIGACQQASPPQRSGLFPIAIDHAERVDSRIADANALLIRLEALIGA